MTLRKAGMMLVSFTAWLSSAQISAGIDLQDLARALLGRTGLRAKPEPPLVIPQKAKTARDYYSGAQRAWCERVLEKPFQERAQGQSWAAEATAFVRECLDVWPAVFTIPNAPELKARGQSLLDAGCDDPLVVYLAAWVRWQESDQPQGAADVLSKLLPKAEALPGGTSLARIIAGHLYEAQKKSNHSRGNLSERIARLTVADWKSGSFRPEEDYILARQIIALPGYYVFDNEPGPIMAAVEKSDMPEWLREAVIGRGEIVLAWDERGGGWADTVTAKGWKGFEAHLKSARSHLVRSWKLRPDAPEAASGMITVVMGGEVERGESERLWLDRTMAAQVDYLPAFGRIANAYLPRWGGSEERMLALARECLATRRFDTDIPLGARIILEEMNRDNPDWRAFFRNKEVARLALDLDKGLIAEPTRQSEKAVNQAWLAVDAWLAGEYATSVKALEDLGPQPFHRHVLARLADSGVDEAFMRNEVAVLASPAQTDYLAGCRAYDRRDLAAAAEAFERALQRAPSGAERFLRSRLTVAHAEQKLATGEWVDLLSAGEPLAWTTRMGTWSFNDSGAPVSKDNYGGIRLVHGARVGANFELRGEIEIAGEPESEYSSGLVFGDHLSAKGTLRWQGCTFYRPYGGAPVGAYSLRNGNGGQPPIPIAIKPVNSFQIKVTGGKLTWSLNETPIHENAPLRDELNAESRVGFGTFYTFPSIKQTLRKLEVRRLASER